MEDRLHVLPRVMGEFHAEADRPDGSMNRSRILLFSICLNVLLLFLLLRSGPSDSPGATGGKIVEANDATGSITATTVTKTLVREIDWRRVESTDYREYIANLRAIGCPEATIRDIIIADVDQLFAEKLQQLRGNVPKFEFWKPNAMAALMPDAGTTRAARALEEEKTEVLRALGIEPDGMKRPVSLEVNDPVTLMLDYLPEDRRAAALKVMADHKSNMMNNAPDMLTALRELEANVASILTPEEFEQFQLRFSPLANEMRSGLPGFEPGESEFLSVFRLRDQFERDHLPFDSAGATAAERDAFNAAKDRLNQELRSTLGEERFDDYQRAKDPRYHDLHQLVRRVGLPTSAAEAVYDTRRVAENKTDELRATPGLTPEQKNATLWEIRRETERTIKQQLGEEGWNHYEQGLNARWLDEISKGPDAQ